MARKPQGRWSWIQEMQFIEKCDPNRPSGRFDHDPACFARYVEMQAGFAREDGFADLADRMLATIGKRAAAGKRAIPAVEVPADLSKWHQTPEGGIYHYHTPDGLDCSYHEFTPEPCHASVGLTVGSSDGQAIFSISASGGTLDGTAFDPVEVREALWKAVEAVGLARRKGE